MLGDYCYFMLLTAFVVAEKQNDQRDELSIYLFVADWAING